MNKEQQNDERQKAAEEAAQECVRVLKEKFDAREAYLFGSLRGDSPFNERSDIDIAVEGLAPGRYIDALVALYELLPEGMELDLVPLERAVPELAALAKGEIKMPENPVEALKVEVQNELNNLERIAGIALMELSGISETPSALEISGMGKHVHDFYEGIERIFERIEKWMEVSLPTGESWHTDFLPSLEGVGGGLLQQMEHEVQNRRPAVIDHALALRLHRYLRFRHLFRHHKTKSLVSEANTYGYELVWDELRPLVEGRKQALEEIMEISGKAWKFGDNINTDEIIPARYLNVIEPAELAQHCMEDTVEHPDFPKKISAGDIIIAGRNFGCGSSREHAPIAIKACQISCVIAKTFARIFYRNAINIGLPILESEEAAIGIDEGDQVEVDLARGIIKNLTRNQTYQAMPFPEFMRQIIAAGGLMNYVKQRYAR